MKEGNKIHDIELGFPFMASAWLQSSSALIEQVLEKGLCRDDTRVVLYEVVWLLKMPSYHPHPLKKEFCFSFWRE